MRTRVSLHNERIRKFEAQLKEFSWAFYTYDAAGVKLRKIARTGGTVISQTDYVGGIQYEGTTPVLKFVATPEGRVVKKGSTWDFEYFHKDHLGNTRVVYGYMKQVDEYKATMETALASQEEAAFKNVAATRVIAYNHTPASGQFTVPDKSAETNGNLSGKAIGPAKMLQVSAGDSLHLEVFARYSTGTGANNTLITTLASAVTGTFGLGAGEAAYNAINNNVPARAATFSSDPGVPKAYLFYILFDNNYVYQQFGYKVVSSGAMADHERLNLGFTIPASGYLYTYVANESNVSSATSVYFDDFNIIHTRATSALQVVQTTDYYPFGLTYNSYKRENSVDQDYKFQGQEHIDDLDLGWDSFKWRNHQPDIGRFFNIDPLAEKYVYNSPYAFSENHVVAHRELEGLEKVLAIFYKGGPTGGGQPIDANHPSTGGAGAIFNSTKSFAESEGREFAGQVIAPGWTSASGVETGQEFMNANYADGDQVIIYGYSYGVDNAMDLATNLGEQGITVNTIVTVDGSDGFLQNSTVRTTVPDNAMNNLNVYQTNDSGSSSSSAKLCSGCSQSDSGTSNSPGSNGGPNRPTPGNPNKVIENKNVTGPGVTHGNIQEKQQTTIQKHINDRIHNYYIPIKN